MPDQAIDALLEIFSWVGFGGAVLVGLLALVSRIADGSWVPAQAVISEDPDGAVARWFGPQGDVGQARLTHEQEQRIGGRDTADVYVRLGRAHRLRLTRSSPVVRMLLWLAVGFAGLGVAASAVSLVLLFVR